MSPAVETLRTKYPNMTTRWVKDRNARGVKFAVLLCEVVESPNNVKIVAFATGKYAVELAGDAT